MVDACCAEMRHELDRSCATHGADPFACPDRVIYRATDGRFGLIVHDGGSSWYEINHCPWCGINLKGEPHELPLKADPGGEGPPAD